MGIMKLSSNRFSGSSKAFGLLGMLFLSPGVTLAGLTEVGVECVYNNPKNKKGFEKFQLGVQKNLFGKPKKGVKPSVTREAQSIDKGTSFLVESRHEKDLRELCDKAVRKKLGLKAGKPLPAISVFGVTLTDPR